jgi:hypothetical protein
MLLDCVVYVLVDGDCWFVQFPIEKDASGANFRNRKGIPKEANIVT